MSHHALILANGEAPSKRTLTRLRKASSFFVCADGGANCAARYSLKPDAIVGDLDSALKTTLRKFANVEIHKVVDDYSTDLEKTLTWITDKGYRTVTVAGATGGRLDHFLGNLSAMVKFSPKASITFVDDTGEWVYVDRSRELHIPVGTTVSLIPLSRCEGIVTKGLRWNLNFEALELGVRDGTSNVVLESPVRISVAKGNLILFHLYQLSPASRTFRTLKRKK
jgi:thiamine pyrophosphokinase